ncbi:MAG: hypothetical protein ACOYUZ_05320 [Patescibacteria group bacterium]
MKQVQRLEQLLRLWEDITFLLSINYRIHALSKQQFAYQAFSSLRTWPRLRQVLLDSITNPMTHDEFVRRFVPPLWTNDLYYGFDQTPYIIYQWTRYSRRVYAISSELQWLLENTSVERVGIEDLFFPFRALALTLEKPLEDEHGNIYDCITINFDDGIYRNSGSFPGSEFIWIDLHNQKLREYCALGQEAKIGIEVMLKNLDYSGLNKVFDKEVTALKAIHPSSMRFDIGPETTLSALEKMGREGNAVRFVDNKFQNVTDHNYQVVLKALRIVIGLCLYLKALPPNNTIVGPWAKLHKKHRMHAKAVISEAEVCLVGNEGVLTPDERIIMRSEDTETSYELSPHFRAGYWRRAPGKGNDPEAPKIVQVRPTIVRRDRLVQGSLPVGTMQKD